MLHDIPFPSRQQGDQLCFTPRTTGNFLLLWRLAREGVSVKVHLTRGASAQWRISRRHAHGQSQTLGLDPRLVGRLGVDTALCPHMPPSRKCHATAYVAASRAHPRPNARGAEKAREVSQVNFHYARAIRAACCGSQWMRGAEEQWDLTGRFRGLWRRISMTSALR